MRLNVTKNSPAYWRVAIDNPQLNHFDQQMADELRQLIEILEKDDDVRVVVFETGNDENYIAHQEAAGDVSKKRKQDNKAVFVWTDFAHRIEKAPFITVGLLRGHAMGVGSEFLLALDARFASREKAILSQLDIGSGLMPNAGGFEKLPSLIGRSRAIEVLLGSQEFDADTAERYGWINRAVPDAELDVFVERFATRIAGFDKKAVVSAKQIINERSRKAQYDDLAAAENKFFELMSSPQTRDRLKALLLAGLQLRDDYEAGQGNNASYSPTS